MRARRRGVRDARAGGSAALHQPVLRIHQRRPHVLLRAHTQTLQVPTTTHRHYRRTTTMPITVILTDSPQIQIHRL